MLAFLDATETRDDWSKKRNAHFGADENARFEKKRRQAPRRRKVSFAKRLLDSAAEDARIASDVLTNSLVLQQWEYNILQGSTRLKSGCEGDRLVRRINEALAHLDDNGFERSSQQRLFHRAFMQASYKMLYGNELHKHLLRLLTENNCSEFRTEVACTTPRRFGKTFSIAMWCAAWLVVGADHDSSIYSTSARVSTMLLELIVNMAEILRAKFGGYVVKQRQEEYVFFMTSEGYENSVHAYPAKSETLRGTGTKKKMGTVVLEEAAYIPPAVVTSIVAPTLTRDNVNLFAISTINSDDVVMRGFMSAKWPDGRSVMRCLNFSLVCKDCRATGREDTCKHMRGDLPHWASSEQHSKLHLLLKESKEVLQREINGLEVSETTKAAFNQHSLNILEDDIASGVEKMASQNVLFTTIDPAAGGALSAFALITCAYEGNWCIVVGAEELGSCSDMDQKVAIVRHIAALKAKEEFAGAHFVICVESNLGNAAENIGNYLREKRVPNITIMKEDDERDGWRTTNDTKKWGYLRMNQILNEHRLKFYKGMVRACGREVEDTAEKVRAKIIDQLRAFTRMILPVKNFWVDPKEIFSGKRGGRDDLAMAMQISLLIYERYISRFEHYNPQPMRIMR